MSARMSDQAERASSTEPSSSMVVMSPGSRSSVTAFEHAAHDLAAARLGQHVHEVQISPMTATGPSSLADRVEQLLPESGRREVPLPEHHERRDDLAAQLVRAAGDARLGHRRVREEGRLDLDRADAVVGDLDDLVGAAGEPDVAVLVDVCRVARGVDAGNPLPVVGAVALRLAPQGGGQPGERALDDHDALLAGSAGLALGRHDAALDAGQRNAGRAGLDREHARP